MPDIKRHVTGLVETGSFFFRDAPHYHYAMKATTLLEDITQYIAPLPSNISEVFNVGITGGGGSSTIALGWGYLFGSDYGGPSITEGNSLTLTPVASPDEPMPIIGPTTAVTYDAYVSVVNPTRDMIAIDESAQTLQITYTSPDNTPNCFGINKEDPIIGDDYSVEVYQQSAYDADSNLLPLAEHSYAIGTDTSQAFSIEFNRSTIAMSLTTVQGVQSSQNPIAVSTNSTDLLDFLRLDDVIWLEFIVRLFEVQYTTDLPASIDVAVGDVFKIINPLDGNAGKYYVLDATRTLVQKDVLPRVNTSYVQMAIQEPPGAPGTIQSNGTIYLKTVNGYDDSNYFDASRVTAELPQAMLEFFDGIPTGTRIYTNRTVLTINNLTDDVLTARTGPTPTNSSTVISSVPDKTTLVSYEHHADGKQRFYAEGIKLNSAPKVRLIGKGSDYNTGLILPFWNTTKKYRLADNYVSNSAPVVITDLLASSIDLPELTNVEFRVKADKEVVFNRSTNYLANPTFLLSADSVTPDAWTMENSDLLTEEGDKLQSVLHDKSIRLNNNIGSLYQHVPGIDPESNYSLSMYAKSITSGQLLTTIYMFDNKDVFLTTSPTILYSSVGDATVETWYDALETYTEVKSNYYVQDSDAYNYLGTIEYNSLTIPTEFIRCVARMVRYATFNISDEPELTPVASSALHSSTTDIVVHVQSITNGTDVVLDCVQLEKSNNPTLFSHSYDMCTVEYESSELVRTPRYLLTSLENRLNSGYLTLTMDKDTTIHYSPETVMRYNVRANVVSTKYTEPWAKTLGVDKFRQVSSFSKGRTEHKGEYFLFPSEEKVQALHFLPEPLVVTQDQVNDLPSPMSVYILAEDAKGIPLPGVDVQVHYSSISGDLGDPLISRTEDDGTGYFPVPPIFTEQLSPMISFGVSGQPLVEHMFGYPVVNSTTITGYTPVAGELFCLFNAKGESSGISTWSTGTAITDYITTTVTSPLTTPTYFMPLSNDTGVPPGYLKWPETYDYELSLFNNASASISFISGVFNNIKHIMMGSSSSTPIVSTYAKTGSDTYTEFYIPTTSFNPVNSSIRITNVDAKLMQYTRVSVDRLRKNQYRYDAETSTILVNDPNITNIEVIHTPHRALVLSSSRNTLYIHRTVLFNVLSSIYNRISTSNVSVQHNDPLPTELSSIPAATPLNHSLHISAAVNVIVPVMARVGRTTVSSEVTYVHKRPVT